MPYFDYSAHTQADPSVLRRLVELEEHTIGNANSAHQEGRAANAVMASILEDIASLCKVSPEELILTSGATESNNLAVKGIAMASRHVGKHIISTAMEHSSVSACLTSLQASGYEIDLVRVGSDGLIDTEELRDLLRRDTCLVSISAVESEAGIVQPVEEIASILASFPNTRLHIDTTQAIGKIPVSFAYGDTISFSPHKFYGLTGTGVLIRKKGVSLSPQMEGGASTTPYRSGTPALSLSGSIVPALETALKEQETHYQEVLKKNLFLKEQLSSIPSIRINSSKHSIPHRSNPFRKPFCSDQLHAHTAYTFSALRGQILPLLFCSALAAYVSESVPRPYRTSHP